MCGIVGGISVRPFAWLDEPGRLRRAIDRMTHRGPDDSGQWAADDRRAFLGHRRLSIIDLAGGHQPIANERGDVHFIYNGEIYNFRALRASLESAGHRFGTHTDGETALHAYEDDADAFVERLAGMFGLAILDERDGSLTLARDRNGIKPLYYHCDGRSLIFASELKAILALLDSRPGVSAAGLRAYLRWKYIPAPLTVYENVHELRPGHVLRVRREPERLALQERCYWEPRFDAPRIRDEREAIEALDARLRAAVTSHLESDVEVGALLSGGVDSSLVVALASIVSGRRIRTFSVGFDEPGFDQLPFARTLAERYNTIHYEEHVALDPFETVPKLVRHFDQPFADSSALACYRVCEVAARYVKVALTGDGGDESFLGYRRYWELIQRGETDSVVRRTMCRAVVGAAGAAFTPEAKFLKRYRARARPALAADAIEQQMCSDALMRRLLGPAYRDAIDDDADVYHEARVAATARRWAPVDIAQYADLRTYLPSDILCKVDRTSMAHSLECRVPLLDHSITEFATSLATDLKMRNGEGKYLLKRVAERYVPHELLYRKKRGFRVPIRRWFKGTLLERTADLLADGALVRHGILDEGGVRWVLRHQRRPWMNLATPLWALLFLEHWARASLEA
jgi:asparagine synthase (glutamine-hydrolysing)